MLSIKEMVAGGRRVKFMHYRQKELWYVTEDGFQFPVPIEDTGDGTFLVEDKAILFMRYIRKQVDNINEQIKAQENDGYVSPGYDIERMKAALASPSHTMPAGLTAEQMDAEFRRVAASVK